MIRESYTLAEPALHVESAVWEGVLPRISIGADVWVE